MRIWCGPNTDQAHTWNLASCRTPYPNSSTVEAAATNRRWVSSSRVVHANFCRTLCLILYPARREQWLHGKNWRSMSSQTLRRSSSLFLLGSQWRIVWSWVPLLSYAALWLPSFDNILWMSLKLHQTENDYTSLCLILWSHPPNFDRSDGYWYLRLRCEVGSWMSVDLCCFV